MEAADIDPYLHNGRQHHNPKPEKRFAEAQKKTPIQYSIATMAHRMKIEADKKFHVQRKSITEPVFIIIKKIIGFRSFLLHCLDAMQTEP